MKPGDTNLVAKLIIVKGVKPYKKALVLKRASQYITKKSPWVWDLPGGHLERGENPIEAARREAREETGLTIDKAVLLDYRVTGDKLTYFYDSPEWQGDVKLSHEHQDYTWVSTFELGLIKASIGETYYNMIMKVLS